MPAASAWQRSGREVKGTWQQHGGDAVAGWRLCSDMAEIWRRRSRLISRAQLPQRSPIECPIAVAQGMSVAGDTTQIILDSRTPQVYAQLASSHYCNDRRTCYAGCKARSRTWRSWWAKCPLMKPGIAEPVAILTYVTCRPDHSYMPWTAWVVAMKMVSLTWSTRWPRGPDCRKKHEGPQ